MKAREYDPVLGRFITPDSIIPGAANSQSYNRYSYVLNNPLSMVDPSGNRHKKLKKAFKKVAKLTKKIVDPFELRHNQYVRMAVAAVAAYYSFGAVYQGLSSWGWASTTGANAFVNGSIVVGSGVVAGSVSGAVSGGIMCGSGCAKNGASSGAISGGLFSGADFISADWGKFGQMAARSTAAGLNANVRGGSFSEAFKSSFGIETLSWAALEMRAYEWGQSCLGGNNNPNCTGESVGFRGIGRKLAGCREGCTPGVLDFGGKQGLNPGQLLGFKYGPGSIGDMVSEAFAGPHDWLNGRIMYDSAGNLRPFFSQGFGDFIGDAISVMNVAPATVFVVPSVIQPLTPHIMAVKQF